MERNKFQRSVFDRNRFRLIDQMNQMDSFTEDELWEIHVQNCKDAGEDICAISSQDTLGDYLGDLAEYGALRHEWGRYWTRDEKR